MSSGQSKDNSDLYVMELSNIFLRLTCTLILGPTFLHIWTPNGRRVARPRVRTDRYQGVALDPVRVTQSFSTEVSESAEPQTSMESFLLLVLVREPQWPKPPCPLLHLAFRCPGPRPWRRCKRERRHRQK